MQKGFGVIYILVGILFLALAVLFIPIPRYDKGELCLMIYPTECHGPGWYLGPSLFQRLMFSFSDSSLSLPKSAPNQVVTTNEAIKIGEYKVLIKDGWEELEYLSTRETKNTQEIIKVFSQLYPQYTDKNGEMYIREITVSGDTAQVYFGGDETWLTDGMGTTGAYNYSGLVTFALTEDPRIRKVDFKLKNEGSHFGPGISTRESFIELWPTELLEKAAAQGNKKAQESLQFRKTANWKTYISKEYDYSIKYPSDFSLFSFDQDYYPDSSNKSGFKVKMHVDQLGNGRASEEKVFGNVVGDDIRIEIYPTGIDILTKADSPQVLETISIDGIATKKGHGLAGTIISVGPITNNNHQYVITSYKNPSNNPAIFNQILSTFKFLEQVN